MFMEGDKILFFIERLQICPFISAYSYRSWPFFLFLSALCKKVSTIVCALGCLSLYLCFMLPAFSSN